MILICSANVFYVLHQRIGKRADKIYFFNISMFYSFLTTIFFLKF